MSKRLMAVVILMGFSAYGFGQIKPAQSGSVNYEQYQSEVESLGEMQSSLKNPQKSENSDMTVTLGNISGTVYESDGVTPVQGASVQVCNSSWQTVRWAYTDAQGNYLAWELQPGEYYVYADGSVLSQGQVFFKEYYPESADKPGASTVSVAGSDTVTNINFTLAKMGAISGRVTDEGTGQPIADAWIELYNAGWTSAGGACANQNGEYTIYGLESGNYYIRATGYQVGMGEFYVEEYYDNQSAQGSANPIPVTVPNTATGIDIAMTRGFHYYINSLPAWGGCATGSPQKLVYTPGDQVTLTATSAQGYRFDHWSGDVDGTDSTVVITLDSDKEINAHFTPKASSVYTLSIQVTPDYYSGWYNIEPNQTEYDSGAVVHVNVQANTGWVFSHWSGDHSGTETAIEVVMDANKVLYAHFDDVSMPQYYLNVGVNPSESGSVTKNPEQAMYDSASVVELTAVPECGWAFKNWMGDMDGTDITQSITMNFDKYISANFGHTLETYTHPEGIGSVTRNPDKVIYDHNEVVQLTAHPPNGYIFYKWAGSISGTQNPINVTIHTNKEIIAKFKEETVSGSQFTLNAAVNPQGSGAVQKTPDCAQYDSLTTVNVKAVAETGWMFSHWSGDLDGTSKYQTLIMDADKNVEAHFGHHLHTWTYPEGVGSISRYPDKTVYDHDEVVQLTAQPTQGYIFDYWAGDTSDTQNPIEVTMDMNKEIKAKFRVHGAVLKMKVEPENGGYTDPVYGSHQYVFGDTIPIAAEPSDGFVFKGWSDNVHEPDSTHTWVIMDSSKCVTAHFQTIDDQPPYLKHCYPSPNSTEVPKNGHIHFWAWDNETGIQPESLNTWVNDSLVVENGVAQTGYTCLVTAAKGIKVKYKSVVGFEEGSTVTVRVTFSDKSDPVNQCDSTYSFFTGAASVDSSVSMMIGVQGGAVVDSISGLGINIPSDALPDSMEIIIDYVQDIPELPDGICGIALPYHFGPDGLQFNTGVVIQSPYTLEDLNNAGITDPVDLTILYFHTSTGEWVELEIDSVNIALQMVYVTVYEFCYFSFGSKDTTATGIDRNVEPHLPDDFVLSQNYPNPFNPTTTIEYTIRQSSHVTVEVFNSQGQHLTTLARGEHSPGTFQVIWDAMDERGNQVGSGLYMYVLKAEGITIRRKAVFLK